MTCFLPQCGTTLAKQPAGSGHLADRPPGRVVGSRGRGMAGARPGAGTPAGSGPCRGHNTRKIPPHPHTRYALGAHVVDQRRCGALDNGQGVHEVPVVPVPGVGQVLVPAGPLGQVRVENALGGGGLFASSMGPPYVRGGPGAAAPGMACCSHVSPLVRALTCAGDWSTRSTAECWRSYLRPA